MLIIIITNTNLCYHVFSSLGSSTLQKNLAPYGPGLQIPIVRN